MPAVVSLPDLRTRLDLGHLVLVHRSSFVILQPLAANLGAASLSASYTGCVSARSSLDARAAADAIERALGETFATPSVDQALTGTDCVVVAIKPKRR